MDGLTDRAKVLDGFAEELSTPLGADPLAPNRAQWGTGPRAAKKQRAMMAMAGPPPEWPPPPTKEQDPSPSSGTPTLP